MESLLLTIEVEHFSPPPGWPASAVAAEVHNHLRLKLPPDMAPITETVGLFYIAVADTLIGGFVCRADADRSAKTLERLLEQDLHVVERVG